MVNILIETHQRLIDHGEKGIWVTLNQLLADFPKKDSVGHNLLQYEPDWDAISVLLGRLGMTMKPDGISDRYLCELKKPE